MHAVDPAPPDQQLLPRTPSWVAAPAASAATGPSARAVSVATRSARPAGPDGPDGDPEPQLAATRTRARRRATLAARFDTPGATGRPAARFPVMAGSASGNRQRRSRRPAAPGSAPGRA